jgi:hypothetical protein
MTEEKNMKKGFGLTIGAIFAVFVVFIVLPFGACVGLTVCGATAVKMGETAKVQEIEALGPEIVFSDLVFKSNDANPFLSKVSYKFTATNTRNQILNKSFNVLFQDADGLEVDKDMLFSEKFGAGETRTLTGTATMLPKELANVVTMTVEVR